MLTSWSAQPFSLARPLEYSLNTQRVESKGDPEYTLELKCGRPRSCGFSFLPELSPPGAASTSAKLSNLTFHFSSLQNCACLGLFISAFNWEEFQLFAVNPTVLFQFTFVFFGIVRETSCGLCNSLVIPEESGTSKSQRSSLKDLRNICEGKALERQSRGRCHPPDFCLIIISVWPSARHPFAFGALRLYLYVCYCF